MQLSSELQFIKDMLGLSFKSNHSRIEVNYPPLWDHVNWDEFIRLATYHGVGGLLFYWLRKLKLEGSLPRAVYRSLHHIYKSLSNIAEHHQKVLNEILVRFNNSGIEIILLKGSQLCHIEYPHFSLRPMGDIDLLVKKSNQLEIIKLMLEMGFNLYKTSQTCDKFFMKGTFKKRKKEIHKPIFVEAHSNFHPPDRLNESFSVDMDEFWNGTQQQSINGFPFLQLCPTYNLIYLCTHLGEHHFSRLIWAYDIALLIHRHGEEIDWGKLEDFSGRMKVRNPLYHSLNLCQEFFQAPIPEKVLKNLSPSWWKRKMGQFLIRKNLLLHERSRVSRLSQFLIKVLSIDSWVEAMLWFLFPTREWIKQQYSVQGTHEIYSYYVLHPILYLIKSMKVPLK